MASPTSSPGITQPGLAHPGDPGALPAPPGTAAVFTLGTSYFRWAAEDPYFRWAAGTPVFEWSAGTPYLS